MRSVDHGFYVALQPDTIEELIQAFDMKDRDPLYEVEITAAYGRDLASRVIAIEGTMGAVRSA